MRSRTAGTLRRVLAGNEGQGVGGLSGDLCVVCRHRTPDRGVVCEPCRDRTVGLLEDLPRKLAGLSLQLVPGFSIGEKVSISRTGSPTGARLEALSLTGPGSDGLSVESSATMRQPLTRRVQFVRPLEVTAVDDSGVPVRVVRDVPVWRKQIAVDADGEACHVDSDDQTGVLPPAEWLDSWVRTWQKHFGHHGLRPRGGRRRPQAVRVWRETVAWWIRRPGGPALIAFVAATALAWQRHVVAATLGMHDGHAGRLTAGQRRGDPLVEEWEVRWGHLVPVPYTHIRYLLTWWDRACDDDVAVADFAAELRAVSAELSRVLGERPDHRWIGRCPADVVDRDSGDTRVCGAGLWQDPYVGVVYTGGRPVGVRVQCPRCRTGWGPDPAELLTLAGQIRTRWPVDRYRRYTADELAGVRVPPCPRCGSQVKVGWRDVTGGRDLQRWWRAETATCPRGCVEARQVI